MTSGPRIHCRIYRFEFATSAYECGILTVNCFFTELIVVRVADENQ